MFHLGDRVKNLETGSIGIVIGFDKRMVDNECLPMIKVKIISPESVKKTTIVDLNTKFLPFIEDYRLIYPNLVSRNLILKPIQRYDHPKTA